MLIIIGFTTQDRHRPAGEDYLLREDSGDDVTGGIQEVVSGEGSVLSLSHDVVDIGHEGVDNWDENPSLGFVRVHGMTKVLTMDLAESIK